MHIAHERLRVSDSDTVDSILLTAPPRDLQALILKYSQDDKAFEKQGEFRRQAAEVGSSYRHLGRGQWHSKQGRYDEAVASLNKALDLRPDFAEAHYALGKAYAEQGHFGQALVFLQKAASLEPSVAGIREALGRSLLAAQRHEQARAEFSAALRIKAGDKSAQSDIAFSYFLEGRFEEATQEFEKYLHVVKDPRSRVAGILGYALSLRHLGRQQEAQNLLERYAKIFSSEWKSSLLLRFYRGELSKAELVFQAGNDPQLLCQAYFYIGYEHFLKGEKPQGDSLFKKACDTKNFGCDEYLAARARLGQAACGSGGLP